MDAADVERMRRLAFELQEFNRLRQSEMSERERVERCAQPPVPEGCALACAPASARAAAPLCA